jgi:hypothetical protein
MVTQRTLTRQSNSEQKTNAYGITIPAFKLYQRAIVTKVAQYWYEDRYVDQWNRIEDLEIRSYAYSHLRFQQSAKNVC